MTTADFCGELFAAGADFIFVHGRTAAQRYDGTASRDEVEKVAAGFPGATLAIVHDGQLVTVRAYGYAQRNDEHGPMPMA